MSDGGFRFGGIRCGGTLLVRRNHAVELRIGDTVASRAWLGWGTPATPGTHVRVDPCDHQQEWVSFAGGYWVLAPGCVPVRVMVDGGPPWEILVPVGAPCPSREIR